MNQNTAQRLDILTEAMDSPLNITSVDGETVPTRGIYYTHPKLLEICANGHRSMTYCEIANAGKYYFIILFRSWQDDHPLKNIADPNKWFFEEMKCLAHIEHEAVADLFEWDETVAYDEEAQYVGRIELEEEERVKLENQPNPSWQYNELFEKKNARMLAPRRTFDHAMNLKEGPEPPWGLIFPMLAHVLNELDKYLKKMLAEGKIADS